MKIKDLVELKKRDARGNERALGYNEALKDIEEVEIPVDLERIILKALNDDCCCNALQIAQARDLKRQPPQEQKESL